jgi:saccharopine dehydrogenase-like NADP-dependent oxidoreductase
MGQIKELATHMGPAIRQLDRRVVPQIKHAVMSDHDEVHSLASHYPQADIRFWTGFGDHYINVFTVPQNLDLLSEQPVVTAEGLEVVPLKVVKAVLPDPSGLAPDYNGKTCIGDLV